MKYIKKPYIINNHKLNISLNPKKDFDKIKNRKKNNSMYNKISKFFKLYDFSKLQLLGDDNKNYGNFIYQGNTYEPEYIKVEYLGDKNIKSNLLQKHKLIKINTNKNTRKISFINPITESINNTNRFDGVIKENSFFDVNLPLIPKSYNDISLQEEKKNFNIEKNNSISNDKRNIKYRKIKSFIDHTNNIKDRNNIENNEYIINMKKRFNSNNNNNNKNLVENNKILNANIIKKNKLIKNINIFEMKNELNKRLELLENKVNKSSRYINNGIEINQQEKPQFKMRFNNLRYEFKKYLDY